MRVGIYVHQVRLPITLRLHLPFHYKTLWSICVSDCVRYGGNWMARTLRHMLTNGYLSSMGGLASQAKHYMGPSPLAA